MPAKAGIQRRHERAWIAQIVSSRFWKTCDVDGRGQVAFIYPPVSGSWKMMPKGTRPANMSVMKQFDWDPEKNQQLIEERGISFEEVIFHLQSKGLLDDMEHPNQASYSHQRMFVVAIEGYAYLVPYVESDKDIFLKTIIPSRKATKKYLGEDHE